MSFGPTRRSTLRDDATLLARVGVEVVPVVSPFWVTEIGADQASG
jgi:hypothetical protein